MLRFIWRESSQVLADWGGDRFVFNVSVFGTFKSEILPMYDTIGTYALICTTLQEIQAFEVI